MILLQQILPESSGSWWVSAIGATLLIASGIVNLIQLSKSREVARWKSTADAAQEELAIQRARAERLNNENKDHLQRIATLEARTDLDSLRAQATDIQNQLHKDAETQLSIVAALDRMHTQMTEESRQSRSAFTTIANTLQAIDARLPAPGTS
jgi:membrane-bound lytic murein transglycosylase